jgi:hypothetical protein
MLVGGLGSAVVGIPEGAFLDQLLQFCAGMCGELGGVVFRRLLALGSQRGNAGGEQRSIFLQHPKQTLGAINLGVNRKHCEP